ncbi:MAG TPA: hypothetical protein VFZ65_20285 [Planctomycetota bacterium]|nr:hypothetical protein [Planctomycetota bacterium]
MNMLETGSGLLLGALLALPHVQDPTPARDKPAVVVGTFDSRGVLFAYVRSAAFQQYVTAQKADIGRALERARTAGDKSLVADLERLGPAMQLRVHQQGFGTAPIDDVLARIEGKLPAIARQAGVDVIVSKWTLAYRDPSAKFVDVTELLAAQFDPSEATLESMRSIVAQDPVPLDQIEEHK